MDKQVLKDWWWLFLIYALCVIGLCFFVYINLPPTYSANSKIFVTPTSEAALANVYDAPYADRAVKTVSTIITSDEMISNIAETTGIGAKEVKKSYKANEVVGTQLIDIKISNKDTSKVAQIAQAIPTSLDNLLLNIQRNTDEKNQIKVSIAEQPSIPKEDILSKLKIIAIILVAALVLGYGLWELLKLRDGKIKDNPDIERAGLSYLGDFARVKNIHKGVDELAKDENALALELLREIRTSVFLNDKNSILKAINITSANPQEGKSAFISSLGMILAEAGKKVVLVDADLKRPTLHNFFSIKPLKGLSEYLNNEARKEEIIYRTKFDNLWIISAGERGHKNHSSSTLFAKKDLDELKGWLIETGKADFILFDSPPVSVTNDAVTIAKFSDATIIVAEQGKTKRLELVKTRNTLKRAKVQILGTVLSKAATNRKKYYYY